MGEAWKVTPALWQVREHEDTDWFASTSGVIFLTLPDPWYNCLKGKDRIKLWDVIASGNPESWIPGRGKGSWVRAGFIPSLKPGKPFIQWQPLEKPQYRLVTIYNGKEEELVGPTEHLDVILRYIKADFERVLRAVLK